MSTEPTPIADYEHPTLQALIDARGWRALPEFDRIGAAYHFVKDELPFGYNAADDRSASQVFTDGYGQCNTKGNLLVALLRGLGISARFHGFTIDKDLQIGAIPHWLQALAPSRILHSWVELRHEGQWIALEGFILDKAYLQAIQARNPNAASFCGYGIATLDLQNPGVDWTGAATYIQREGIVDDFGVFDSPDDFYKQHGTNLSGLRRWLFQRVVRHLMNRNVAWLRAGRS